MDFKTKSERIEFVADIINSGHVDDDMENMLAEFINNPSSKNGVEIINILKKNKRLRKWTWDEAHAWGDSGEFFEEFHEFIDDSGEDDEEDEDEIGDLVIEEAEEAEEVEDVDTVDDDNSEVLDDIDEHIMYLKLKRQRITKKIHNLKKKKRKKFKK